MTTLQTPVEPVLTALEPQREAAPVRRSTPRRAGPVRFGIVGCGFVADFYMKTLSKRQLAELVADMKKHPLIWLSN